MKTHISAKHITRLMGGLIIVLLLNGCAGGSWFSYTGREAKPENRFVLKEGGPHSVIWHSPDLDLHYRYHLEGNQLTVEGRVVRQNRIKHFSRLKAWVSIHILDANGIILDTHRLWSQNGSDVYGFLRWDFKKSWQLPPDNRAVGFSFSGVAGGGGENGSQWDFWQTP
ncbi:MAG: hypothetical protein HF981_16655 [Desulfobacteraceae bacterium]|nr:hypothetical protein [Desulfobacteraceae bacterium]MBC2752021.1 hypothetical protein [Desulfobacteraceae bacterium]